MKRKGGLSPRKRPAQARARETVNIILEAAAQVFGELGYAASTTNHIARRAGVSIGSLYQYFPNKDAILFSLMERHIDEGYELIVRAMAEIEKAGLVNRGVIRTMVETMVALHRKAPELHRVLFEEVPFTPFLEGYRKNESYVVEKLADLLEKTPNRRRGRSDNSLKLFSQVVESMTHRFILAGPSDLDEAEFIEEITDMMTRYLLAGDGA